MSIVEKFGNLGYDLIDLDDIFYLNLDTGQTTATCPYDSCKGGCTPTCITCKNGGSTG